VIPKLQAAGMIEFNSIAAGIEAADHMFKAAQVEPLVLKTICPGKFLAGVYADVARVKASINAGLDSGKVYVVDHFVIPNIDHSVISAMNGAVEKAGGAAVGVIETFSASSSITAADTAVKAAKIDLIEVRLAMGLGGKGLCILSGDVGAVQMAVHAGAADAGAKGLLVNKVIIPSISPQVLRYIL
jgi:microcompartment protein CcmL/EutN